MTDQAKSEMNLVYLDERQNEAFDYEYHSEEELIPKIAFVRSCFADGPARILDVGGGNGKFIDRLLREFPKAQGYVVDVSRKLLDGNQANPRKTLIHGSFEDLPRLTPGVGYDLITINWVLHHLVGETYRDSVANVEKGLAMAASMLTPRGIILVAENEYQGLLETNAPSHIIWAITRVRHPGFARLAGRYFNTAGTGVCFQSERGWRRIFARTGFSIKYYQRHYRWPHGLKKRLMFLALLLRTQCHGHFALQAQDRGRKGTAVAARRPAMTAAAPVTAVTATAPAAGERG